MTKKTELSPTAFGGVAGKDYKPFVDVSTVMPETTIPVIIIGTILTVFFAMANTYLALKIGLTIAAGIPGAIVGTAILRLVLRRNNILENNQVSAMAGVGESLAGGLTFVVPAILLWKQPISLFDIFIIGLIGGLLGTIFVAPVRKYLIVEQHGTLVFPESMAISTVLVSTSVGGQGAITMGIGLIIGMLYKAASGIIGLFSESPEFTIKWLNNTIIGINNEGALMGVGLIIGLRAAAYMFAGSVIAWLGLIPLIKFIGAGLTVPIYPSHVVISQMGAWAIWSSYIRYVGAGAVATGGIITLIRMFPTIYVSFKSSIAGMMHKDVMLSNRTTKEFPLLGVVALALLVFFGVGIFPIAGYHLGFLASLLIIIFSFFFSVVSARMVGLVGSTNNPISGMTIATLLVGGTILKLSGMPGGMNSMMIIIIFGAIVCMAAGVAGGVSQSLKPTFIIGGTPRSIYINMFIGLIFGVLAAAFVLFMMNKAYVIGSPEIPAPQAGLMSLVVQGITEARLPWTMVSIGVMIAIAAWIMRLPVMMLALGLYLPIHLMSGLFVGGVLRKVVDYFVRNRSKDEKTKIIEKSVLMASGLIAGDALLGIIVAVLVVAGLKLPFLNIWITHNAAFSIACLLALCALLVLLIVKRKKA